MIVSMSANKERRAKSDENIEVPLKHVASELHVSRNTVKKLEQEALKKLRVLFDVE